MTIANLKKGHIECSICEKGPNEGKYFTERVIFVSIKKKFYENAQNSSFARIENIIGNPKGKVYRDGEATGINELEIDSASDYFAIFCPNCVCDICKKLTVYAEVYDKSRQNSYCENKCKPFWEFGPEKDREEFKNFIEDSKIKIKEEL